MKIIETLTTQQKIDLFNGNTVSFFVNLFQSTDSFYSMLYDLCLGYYTQRSGEKEISETYNKILDIINDNSEITESSDDILSKIIRNKFIDKWNNIYNALYEQQYNILDGYLRTNKKIANNTETMNYDNNINETGNRGTNISTTTEDTSSNDVYGFNSNSPVGNDVNTGKKSETVIGNKDSNTYENDRNKTGTDTNKYNIDETNETNGRDGSASDYLNKEINFRIKNIFFDIIYSDIDSITTLQIYI